MHEPAVRAITSVIESGEPVVLTPQVMAEFRNVVTRPLEKNGLGLSPEEARDEIARIVRFLLFTGRNGGSVQRMEAVGDDLQGHRRPGSRCAACGGHESQRRQAPPNL